MEIKGLNEQQRRIADMIWSMDTKDEIYKFIDGCPSSIKADAKLVFELMLLAVYDECTDTDLAEEVIERIK